MGLFNSSVTRYQGQFRVYASLDDTRTSIKRIFGGLMGFPGRISTDTMNCVYVVDTGRNYTFTLMPDIKDTSSIIVTLTINSSGNAQKAFDAVLKSLSKKVKIVLI